MSTESRDGRTNDDRPSSVSNDEEREVQVDEIIERIERLHAEAARLMQLAARLRVQTQRPKPAKDAEGRGLLDTGDSQLPGRTDEA